MERVSCARRVATTLASVALVSMTGIASAGLVWDVPLSLTSTSTAWQAGTTVAAFDVGYGGTGNVGTSSWGGVTWTRVGNTDPINGGAAVTVGGITYTDSNYHGDGTNGRYYGVPVLDNFAGGIDGVSTPNTYVQLSGFDASKTYIVQYFTGLSYANWKAKILGMDGVGNSDYATLGADYAVFSGTLTNDTSLKVEPRLSSGGTADSNFFMEYYSGVRVAEIANVPEPSAMTLVAIGLLPLVSRRARRALGTCTNPLA